MNEDGALFDARFDDDGPFRDTPEPGGISLETALRDFGPAALDDLIPRVRVLARALDAAHARGVVHGALNPSKIIITDEGTAIIRGETSYAPYLAPEVAGGEPATAASDQFSLAALTYEWLFGKRIDGPAHRTVAVKAMPDVNRSLLAKAFSRALAVTPDARFARCMDFCNALAAATAPELPLAMAGDDEGDELDSVGPFMPEVPRDADLPVKPVADDRPAPNIDDVKIVAEETNLTGAQPDFDAIVPMSAGSIAGVDNPPHGEPPAKAGGFTGTALIIAALVGAVFGFAGGYMARPRALQSGPAETFATPAVNVPPANASNEVVAPAAPPKVSTSTPRETKRTAPPARTPKRAGTAPSVSAAQGRSGETASKRDAAAPAATTGGMIVDSRPGGARVTINGRASGTTPLTIDDLAPGEYRVVMTLPGFRNFATTVRVVAGERVRAAYSLTAQEQE